MENALFEAESSEEDGWDRIKSVVKREKTDMLIKVSFVLFNLRRVEGGSNDEDEFFLSLRRSLISFLLFLILSVLHSFTRCSLHRKFTTSHSSSRNLGR